MLTRRLSHTHQCGLVLVLALIVLAAMSLAAVGLMRGVFGSNRVAGNLAFQQAATQAADVGVERAVAWLEQQSRATVPAPSAASAAAAGASAPPPVPSTRLYDHVVGDAKDPTRYMATRGDPNFSLGQTWETYWQSLAGDNRVNDIARDANGNQVSYVIQRLCGSVGAPADSNCDSSPEVRGSKTGSKSNTRQVQAPSAVYYRITVRVQGPRNATSFIQTVVAI